MLRLTQNCVFYFVFRSALFNNFKGKAKIRNRKIILNAHTLHCHFKQNSEEFQGLPSILFLYI